MRTPNCECLVCKKPLYRRPNELEKVRHVACLAHRAEAQKLSGVTPAQRAALALGSVKGTNHRTGYAHREESKRKASESHKRWAAENPDKVAARAEKTRGALHYQWKGGSSKLGQSIRQMTEYRKWVDAVRKRDGRCVQCESTDLLESHHIKPLAVMIAAYVIDSRASARACPALWDISNGQTLCAPCHYKIHGRKYAD